MVLVDDRPNPSFRIMQSRKIYNTLSVSNRVMGEQPNINLTSKYKRLYSKIDTEGDSIMLIPNLTQKDFLNSAQFGLGFIVDSCNDFMTEYNQRITNDPSSFIPELGPLNVTKKSIDYKDLAGQRRSIIANYIASYYFNIYGKKIRTFDDFMKVFMRWASESVHTDPITNSGIILSHATPHAVNGLVVQFGDLDENNDALRGAIVSNPAFNIYSNMAAKYGFYVTKNSPWRIIANLESPVMHSYIDNYVINSYSNLSDFFGDFYIKTHKLDLRDLRSFILAVYNGFVHFNPILKEKKICSDGSLLVVNHPRQKTTLPELDEKYGIVWWMERLYDIRCLETQMPKKTELEKQKIYELIKLKYLKDSTRAAIDFVAEIIKNG